MRRPVVVNLFLCRWGQNSSPCRFERDCLHAELPLLSPPFHPNSGVSVLLARCKLGVLDLAGAATCYCGLSLDLADGVLGQANDAVTGTRLVTLNPPYI
jgi:hypothetical protein